MRTRIAGALLVGALALSPGFALAEETDASIEQLIVNSAHSPADHAALAKYYRGRAEEELGEASRMDSMARLYLSGKIVQNKQMEGHCKKIAANKRKSADEYKALAKLHEADAKNAK